MAMEKNWAMRFEAWGAASRKGCQAFPNIIIEPAIHFPGELRGAGVGGEKLCVGLEVFGGLLPSFPGKARPVSTLRAVACIHLAWPAFFEPADEETGIGL